MGLFDWIVIAGFLLGLFLLWFIQRSLSKLLTQTLNELGAIRAAVEP